MSYYGIPKEIVIDDTPGRRRIMVDGETMPYSTNGPIEVRSAPGGYELTVALVPLVAERIVIRSDGPTEEDEDDSGYRISPVRTVAATGSMRPEMLADRVKERDRAGL